MRVCFHTLLSYYCHKHTVTHTHTQTHSHTHTHKHTHTNTQSHTHTHTNTQSHTHTNTQSHTHKHRAWRGPKWAFQEKNLFLVPILCIYPVYVTSLGREDYKSSYQSRWGRGYLVLLQSLQVPQSKMKSGRAWYWFTCDDTAWWHHSINCYNVVTIHVRSYVTKLTIVWRVNFDGSVRNFAMTQTTTTTEKVIWWVGKTSYVHC